MATVGMTTTTTLPPKGGWRVGTQVASTRRSSSGEMVQGMEVHFVTGYGVSSSVWVPNATYSEQKVRAAIARKASTLDAVARLTSTTGE